MIYRIVCRVLPLVMIVTLLAGCRSKKDNVQPDIRIEEVAENVAPWRNVYLPVKVELLSPKRFAMSGRATMVWNESIYLSMRMFGFEVGTAYADSSEAVVTLRQPQKVMIELPLSDLLKKHDVDVAVLQQAMLGSRGALALLPSAIRWQADSDERKSEVMLSAVYKGKEVAVKLTWDLGAAQWNMDDVRRWSPPGADYRRLSVESAMKIMESL